MRDKPLALQLLQLPSLSSPPCPAVLCTCAATWRRGGLGDDSSTCGATLQDYIYIHVFFEVLPYKERQEDEITACDGRYGSCWRSDRGRGGAQRRRYKGPGRGDSRPGVCHSLPRKCRVSWCRTRKLSDRIWTVSKGTAAADACFDSFAAMQAAMDGPTASPPTAAAVNGAPPVAAVPEDPVKKAKKVCDLRPPPFSENQCSSPVCIASSVVRQDYLLSLSAETVPSAQGNCVVRRRARDSTPGVFPRVMQVVTTIYLYTSQRLRSCPSLAQIPGLRV